MFITVVSRHKWHLIILEAVLDEVFIFLSLVGGNARTEIWGPSHN